MITNIDTTDSNNIDTMINSFAHLVTIISFTSATVATAATTAAKVTVFTTASTTTIHFNFTCLEYFSPLFSFSQIRLLAVFPHDPSLLLQHAPNSNQASFEDNSGTPICYS